MFKNSCCSSKNNSQKRTTTWHTKDNPQLDKINLSTGKASLKGSFHSINLESSGEYTPTNSQRSTLEKK